MTRKRIFRPLNKFHPSTSSFNLINKQELIVRKVALNLLKDLTQYTMGCLTSKLKEMTLQK